MPSFDIVSEVPMHEVTNAVDQANREVSTRFDFRNSGARFEREGNVVTQFAPSEFQLQQMRDILYGKLSGRGVDIRCTDPGQPQGAGKEVRQAITLRQGIDADLARRIVKLVKESKLKVQAAVQGEQVRVTGKKRDDLQQVMSMLRKSELSLPIQFINLRD